jgi:hypothetical protein
MADSLPTPPVTWEDIPLGPGQSPGPLGHLQFTRQGSAIDRTDVRRAPGYTRLVVVHRPPERPV